MLRATCIGVSSPSRVLRIPLKSALVAFLWFPSNNQEVHVETCLHSQMAAANKETWLSPSLGLGCSTQTHPLSPPHHRDLPDRVLECCFPFRSLVLVTAKLAGTIKASSQLVDECTWQTSIRVPHTGGVLTRNGRERKHARNSRIWPPINLT